MGAHLIALRRTAIGAFRVEEASTLERLDALAEGERTSSACWIPLCPVPLPFPAIALLPGEAAKVRRGHAVPVKTTAETSAAPWIRLLTGGDLLALAHLEPLGRGALALARPKIVLTD
jgi:tRNA pseudouridine55 synthase